MDNDNLASRFEPPSVLIRKLLNKGERNPSSLDEGKRTDSSYSFE